MLKYEEKQGQGHVSSLPYFPFKNVNNISEKPKKQ